MTTPGCQPDVQFLAVEEVLEDWSCQPDPSDESDEDIELEDNVLKKASTFDQLEKILIISSLGQSIMPNWFEL